MGVNHTFYVIFTPLEYVPTMAKRPHFFGSGFLLLHPTSSLLVFTDFRSNSNTMGGALVIKNHKIK